MRWVIISLVTVTALLGITVNATAVEEVKDIHVTASPFVGTTLWSDDLGLQNDVLLGMRLGLMFDSWIGLEGSLSRSNTETEFADYWQTTMQHQSANLLFNFYPSHRLSPYLTGGYSWLTYGSSAANSVNGPRHELNGWELGAGVNYRLLDGLSGPLDLRLDVRDVYVDLEDPFPDPNTYRHNLLVSAGLMFTFGRSSQDSDGDAVPDRQDRCPDTPRGALVDANGCPADDDQDGVFDGIDLCVDTPTGAVVDVDGCPSDSDGDGVANGIDRCDDTPAGAVVNAAGCPSDSDGDGVPDGIDLCADTPTGAVINAEGCPRDTDGDGIYDGIDQCANTPAHLEVDEIGCPIEVSETETELLDTGMIRASNILFASGQAELDPASYPVIDDIGKTLVNWPELKIEIGGHTDSQGAESLNQELSQARAQAVLDYLIARFPTIQAGQFTAVGYGESQPIAGNNIPEGRAQNRRVEFKVLNTDQIKRVIESRKFQEK